MVNGGDATKHWHFLRLFFGELVTTESKLVEASQNELV